MCSHLIFLQEILYSPLGLLNFHINFRVNSSSSKKVEIFVELYLFICLLSYSGTLVLFWLITRYYVKKL